MHTPIFIVILCIFLYPDSLLGQCSGYPATVAASDCALYPPISNNISVGAGQTVALCQSDDGIYNYTAVNLNGGTIRICANATISGTWNSGIIVVECGATLSFPNGLLLNNNIGIINYGTVVVTGSLTFQNTGNYFYNQSDSSRLLVSGSVLTPQNTNQTAYIRNNGYMSISSDFEVYPGCQLCLGPNSEIDCNRFNYMQNCGGLNNRVQRETNVNTATIRFTTEARLRGTATNNSTIQFWRASSASTNLTGCGSFGSGVLVNNAPAIPVRPAPYVGSCDVPNCRTIAIILPVELAYFSATLAENNSSVLTSWETINEVNCDYFEVRRSTDGLKWETLGSVKGSGNSQNVISYSFPDWSPLNGVSYYRLDQYDFNGEVNSSGIRSVKNTSDNNGVSVYPNPANHRITVSLPIGATEVCVHSITGEKLLSIQKSITAKSVQFDISHLSNGVYFIRTETGTVKFHKIGNL